jgi:hypothetical protein
MLFKWISDGQFTLCLQIGLVWKAENAAVGFDVLTTCQPSTIWCGRERLPAAAAQPAKVRQSCSATDLFFY